MDEKNSWNRITGNIDKLLGSKRHDFWKGVGIGIAILFSMTVLSVLSILIYLGLIIVSLCIDRNKFALGLISSLLIPVAIMGGCLLVLSGI